MTEDARSNVLGFSDDPHAVQFFLCTYAKDEYLEEADEKLIGMKQATTENIQHYIDRLTAAARDLAGAYSQQKLITIFQRRLAAELPSLMKKGSLQAHRTTCVAGLCGLCESTH